MFLRGLILIFLLAGFAAKPQQDYSKQELLRLIAQPANDTTLINAYNELAWPIYSYDLPDSSVYYASKAIALAEKTGDLKRLSVAHRRLGITYINMGDIKSSIQHQEESYQISEKIGYTRGMHLALNNIGVVYMNNDLLTKALGYFLKSLNIVENTGDYRRVANLYFNCGMIYKRIGDYKKANYYFSKALHYAAEQHEQETTVIINCNLSSLYRNTNQLDSAMFYLAKAKKGLSETTSTNTKYNYYLNEGLLYSYTNQHEKALQSFLGSTDLATNTSDRITLQINIGEEYKKLGNNEKMAEYFKKAYELSRENKMYNNLQYLSYALADYYNARHDYPNYAAMMNLHVSYRDSNDKYARAQQIQQQQLEFDYERRHVADSLKFQHKENVQAMQLEMAEARLNKEKYFKIMLLVILGVIILFAIFIFNRFMLTKRQKEIIENQKQIVEVKNREMLDSINYARRLQSAILPQMADIKSQLDLDILYLPKDIIGGDFYFFEKHRQHVFMAVCDCTGHGVPGAIMSVVCHQALQKSIKEFHLTEPHLILAKTRQIIIESLNASQQNIQDGMDCSLLAIDTATNTMSWSGAYHPIWLSHQGQLTEISGDKQPVALYEKAGDFAKHELKVSSGDLIYLFTDGFADQFGGDKGKKFKQKQLKELLTTVSGMVPEEQVALLRSSFISWKGHLDQVDDVTVAVIRV